MTRCQTPLFLGVAAAALAAFPDTARSSETNQALDDPITYQCANGMDLEVSYLSVQGHGAALIAYPDSRTPGTMATKLLAETQTGSGVRYASDISVLHVKNDTARFETAESAVSEAVPSTQCTAPEATAAPDPAGPVTHEALAGRYFLQSPEGPGYFPVEAICFASDGAKFFGLSRASEEGAAVTYTEARIRYAKVSPVDAGAGMRRYTLSATDDTASQIQLSFIAPGMREAHLPSATAGFSSISEGRYRAECVDSDRVVYVGTNSKHGVAVTLEDDGLALRAFGEGQDPSWPAMRKGYLALGDDHAAFHFVDGEGNHVSVKANNFGGLIEDAWRLDTPIARRSSVPTAYFLADRAAYLKGSARITLATSKLLDRLSLCNHLAGETSGVSERDKQVASHSSKAGCEAVAAEYEKAVARYADAGSLADYLKRQSPVWK